MPGLKTLARGSLDQLSLGNLIVEEGIVDPDKMSELLSEFRSTNGELLGQFLVKKGVITNEKLQLLLIRQAAARCGGVNRRHVDQAVALADRTSRKMLDEVDDFIEDVYALVARAKVGASSDTGS